MAPPLCSSDEVIRALERLGCSPSRRAKGSHQVYQREADGRTLCAVVPIGKREIARGTLRSILSKLIISEEAFRDALKKR